MATRTIKLLGKAYSADDNITLTINFNNTQVFTGNIATDGATPPVKGETGEEKATWTVDTSLSGSIPLSIDVSGGTFQFNNLIGSHTGFELEDGDDGWNVVANAYVITTSPANYYGELNVNTADSDGKTNVVYTNNDNDAPTRTVVDANDTIGDWVYTIEDGETFSCDFEIDSSLLVLDSDVPTYTP
jgi:hypothetical protein